MPREKDNKQDKEIKRLKKTVSKMKKQLRPEYKFHYLNVAGQLSSAYSVSSSGEIFCLNEVAEGDASTQRDGLSIQQTSVYVKGQMAINQSAANTTLCVIIFRDKSAILGQTSGPPAITQLLESDNVMSVKNRFYRDRFEIYYDKRHFVSISGTQVVPINFYKKLNLPVKYASNASADPIKNPLYVYMVSDESTNTPYVQMVTRSRYTDM